MLGVVIDDLVLFEIVAAGLSAEDPSMQSGHKLDAALAKYTALGLIPQCGKTFRLEDEAEFWGVYVDGVSGMV